MNTTADTIEFFDRHAAHYSSGYALSSFNLYENWYTRRRLRVVLDHAAGAATVRRYADVGCGSGEVTLALHRRLGGPETIALDLAPGMLELLRRRAAGDIDVKRADATDTGLPAGAFDLVTSIGVLPYLLDPQPGVDEIARLLAPGKTAVITYPLKQTPMRLFRETRLGRYIKNRIFHSAHYAVRWSPEEFLAAVERAGLTIVRRTSLWPSELCIAARKA